MIYPKHFEEKIGFTAIRTLIKGRCFSTLGTEWVDQELHFMTDSSQVREALMQAQEFGTFLKTGQDIYENNFYDVRHALLRIRPERTYMEELELFDLMRSLETIRALVSYLRDGNDEDADSDAGHSYPALARMSSDVPVFPDIIRRIDAILNKYGKVKDTASPELQNIRQQLEATARSISHLLRRIVTEAKEEGYIDRDVTPTVRDGRMVIPVGLAAKRKIKGIVHDESATGKTVFIEPSAVVEANNRVRELKAEEQREVMRILHDMTNAIRPHAQEMIASLHYLAHIDYLQALAQLSANFGSIVPELTDGPVISLSQAVHPLLRLSLAKHGKEMMPLNVRLKPEQHILLISGPNAGGKSVCLKTVGLLQYMLQCGMPVPVGEATTMGVFDDIFVDIGDEQSIENELSTYSGHLQNMKQMMKSAGHRSLLLIDEFGSGTEPHIGGAIAEAVLDRFVKCGAYGIITTHYQNLKLYAQEHESIANGAMLYDRARMAPLFKLNVGSPGSSFAIEIARNIGFPPDVIQYASDIAGSDYIQSDKYLQDIIRDKAYWANKRASIHDREKRLEETIARYQQDLESLQARRKEILAEAKEEAQTLIKQSNATIENTIRKIKEAQAERNRTLEARSQLKTFQEGVEQVDEQEQHIARQIEKIRRRQERRAKGKPRSSATSATSTPAKEPEQTPLKEGDAVIIKGLNTTGQISEIRGKQAYVLLGGSIRTLVPLANLKITTPPPAVTQPTAATKAPNVHDTIHEARLRFQPDIDLRGMRAAEALTQVARFVDDAIQLDYPRVRILHGTGTGALRMAIRQYLASVPGIRDYHDEHVQFGGAGITVVNIE